MTRFVLVRHGESTVTVNRVIGGPRTCSGLSPLGRQQALRLHDRWATAPEFEADVLIASQYPRAIETAHLINPALGGLEVVIDEGFGELNPGPECDGLTYADFLTRHRIDVESWKSVGPFDITFPGGESVAAFHYRVGAAVHRLLDEHRGKTVVVACHGGVVDAMMRQAMRAPAMGGFHLQAVNASVTELTLVEANTWRVERYNDAAHLVGLPLSTNPPHVEG